VTWQVSKIRQIGIREMDVVPADRGHGACLRTFDALILRDHKADFAANLELVKAVTGRAVLVEINLLTI
jgi:hypothetical protein